MSKTDTQLAAADRLARALDVYLLARHNGQPDEHATTDLLNARQDYEHARQAQPAGPVSNAGLDKRAGG